MPSKSHEHAHSLSLWKWLVLLTKATGITLKLVSKAVKAGLGGQKKGLTFYQFVVYRAIREYQCGLDAVGIQNLLPPTLKTCERFARRHKIEQSNIHLADGTIVPWLGSHKAPRTVVLFHGGGYMSPVLSEQVSLAFGFAKPSHTNVSVIILPYDLACEDANRYPRQLQQAASLFGHLIHSEKLSPATIILLGDSAGAHLLLSLLLHLRHPHPLVPHVETEANFLAAALISPWVTMETSADSIHSNDGKDILSPMALGYWAQNFLGGAALDYWNSPLMAPEEWWSDLPVDDILVIYGDDELFRDDILGLCAKLGTRKAKTTSLNFPSEIHVHMVMNRFLRINALCESEIAFSNWISGHLNTKKAN